MIKTVTLADFDPDMLLVASDKDMLMQGLQDLLAAARQKWISLAGERLNSSRRFYIDAIQEIEFSPESLSGFVALVGDPANSVEQGMDPFDMHSTLLGPNVPVAPLGQKGKRPLASGQGYYRAIPFRHQTPGTIGKGGGTPMGSAYEGHPAVKSAKKLGNEIYGLAKQLGKATLPGGQKYTRLEAGLAPLLKQHHSTDIYAGMVRTEAAYSEGVKQTGGYFTFRTISDNVAGKWLHPGIEAKNLAAEVEEHVAKLAPLVFQKLFQ